MEIAVRLRHRKRPGHGHAYDLLGEHDQRVSGPDGLVALSGAIGIAGAGKGMMAPGGKGEAFAAGQHDDGLQSARSK